MSHPRTIRDGFLVFDWSKTIQQRPVTTLQNLSSTSQPIRLLWITCDYGACLNTAIDTITPEIFLTLMAHPAINQIKRFTQSGELGPDDIADWAPGIFAMHVYRSDLADVLNLIINRLSEHLSTNSNLAQQPAMTVYVQLGERHHPTTVALIPNNVVAVIDTIEAMVNDYEKARQLPQQ